MKIGVISDTHDRLESLKQAIKIFKENKVAMIVHCGDWASPFVLPYLAKLKVPVKGILGNIKGDLETMFQVNSKLSNPFEIERLKPSLIIEIGGRKIFVIHGDDKESLKEAVDSKKYDVVFTGHTHLPSNEKQGKTLVLNPGSTSFVVANKIADKASVAIYDTDTNKAKIIEFTKDDIE